MANTPSYAQLGGLVEFLEINPAIAKGLLRTTRGELETKRKWANLATNLNSLGGANKNGEGWAQYWDEKKCALKEQCAELAVAMRRTGGETADILAALSALDSRLVAVMGGIEFATGDSRLAINPVPQLTTPTGTESPVVIQAEDHSYIVPVQEDTEMHSLHSYQVSPIPSTSHNDDQPASYTIPARGAPLQNTIPPRPRRRRSLIPRSLDARMQQFVNIEARRVKAELATARAFTQLSERIGNISSALMYIVNEISDIVRKMPKP